MEIGSPMASLYLLGNPDHYTSHIFVTIYWRQYVKEVMKPWKQEMQHGINTEGPDKVVLQRVQNRYVGVSSVHDYVYRPRLYEDIDVYEWVQKAKRMKQPSSKQQACKLPVTSDELNLFQDCNSETEKGQIFSRYPQQYVYSPTCPESDDELNLIDATPHKDDPEMLYFSASSSSSSSTQCDDDKAMIHSKTDNLYLEEHPLHETHMAVFDQSKENVVPNFIGGTLPRRDQGDREFYCMTMLALFKPWRNGKDLKVEGQSWDEAFESHTFTNRQCQLMDNFNIRYECNDARDDFSAQMKQAMPASELSMQYPTLEDFSVLEYRQGDDFGDDEGEENINYGVNCYTVLGPRGKVIQAQMNATENCLRNAGWLDESPDGMNLFDTNPFRPDVMLTAEKWKAIVQDRRQNVLMERCANITKHVSEQCKDVDMVGDGKVAIVDRSYLHQLFQAKCEADQKLIDITVINFNLNNGQERAFRIVANHVVSHGCENLKMYLGGMGGDEQEK
jgi:hypothetical protein